MNGGIRRGSSSGGTPMAIEADPLVHTESRGASIYMRQKPSGEYGFAKDRPAKPSFEARMATEVKAVQSTSRWKKWQSEEQKQSCCCKVVFDFDSHKAATQKVAAFFVFLL